MAAPSLEDEKTPTSDSNTEQAPTVVHVQITADDGASVPFDLDASISLATQIGSACELLDIHDRPAQDCSLLAAPRYLTAEDWLEGVPTWLMEGHVLELVPSPTVEVAQVLEQLTVEAGGHDAMEQRKRRVFWMRQRLQIAVWAEEFVAQDGLAVLLELLESTLGTEADSAPILSSGRTRQRSVNRLSLEGGSGSSALQGYCLMALRQALCWQSAMTQLCSSPSHAYLLFLLLYSTRLRVISRALELLFVCCSATHSVQDSSITFSTVLAAAATAAHAHDEEPLAVLVRHVQSADMDVKLNALTLVNCLISAAGGRTRRQRLIFELDRLGINEALLTSVDIEDVKYNVQLDVYAGQVRLASSVATPPSPPDSSPSTPPEPGRVLCLCTCCARPHLAAAGPA